MENYIEELLSICKLPISEIKNDCKIIQIGESLISVTNYKSIIDYTLDKVVLKIKEGLLEIVGENLIIKLINKSEIIICGKIKFVGREIYEK